MSKILMVVLMVFTPVMAIPKPVANGRSASRCRPFAGEQFILCAEGWSLKGRPLVGCERHRPGSQFQGPYGLGTQARASARKAGIQGCGHAAAQHYINTRYNGSWTQAVAHHKRMNWY
jgi:hypothetical protein